MPSSCQVFRISSTFLHASDFSNTKQLQNYRLTASLSFFMFFIIKDEIIF